MFWNVRIICNAFIRTTDHCKVQTAFVSLFYYIFINMKPWNASSVVGRPRPLTGTQAFNDFFTNSYDFYRAACNADAVWREFCLSVRPSVKVVRHSLA